MTSQLTTTEFSHYRRNESTFGNWRDTDSKEAFVVEGWGEGFMLGALFIMVLITIVNMRKGVLLHKIIMLEVRITTEEISSPLIKPVIACDEPRNILLHVLPSLWLLSLSYGRAPLLLLFHAQCCGLDEDTSVLHWTTAIIWSEVLELGPLDLSHDARYDDTGAHIRDVQQFPVLQ